MNLGAYIERSIGESQEKDESTAQSDNNTKHLTPTFVKSTIIRRGSRSLSPEEIDKIKKLIKLSEEVKKEIDSLRKQFKLGKEEDVGVMSVTDPEYFKASGLCRNRLWEYLESLPDEELTLIKAVMYGGRDAYPHGRAYPLEEMIAQFENDRRESSINTIFGKTSRLDVYLKSGIESYK